MALTDGGSLYDVQLAGTGANTYAVTSDGSGGPLVKASTTQTVPALASPLFFQAMAGFAVPGGPQGGHAARATLAESALLTPVGSGAAVGEWHGRQASATAVWPAARFVVKVEG